MAKKIAFIGPLPPPVGGVALANIRAQEIVQRLAPEHEIITLDNSKKSINADLYKRKGLSEMGHFIKNIGKFLGFIFKNRIAVANVFVVPNISFVREAVYILLLKLKPGQLVVHLHAKTSGDLFLSGFKLKLFTKIVGLGDVVFVLSEKHHRQFYAKYIKPEKLVVLENFVTYSDFDNQISQKEHKFLYVGRLSEKKGFKTLVEAVALAKNELSGLTIEVLGAFENAAFEQEMNQMIQDHQLSQFRFHGPQMGQEKFEQFKRCSVFVFPSYFENSPIVLKEAIAAKMAILSSDIQENQNLLEDFDNKVLFKAQDAEDLSKKLINCFKDKTSINAMMLASEKIKNYDVTEAERIIANSLDLDS
ncbi:glycosyltransferase family 4 protein [Gilvibacter sp.]|uniref:glycosyltransferase family 4 protein n=1 Tax=Gilvibacter sp. TaxID=2729997 RepID=UPI0025C01D9A|nr:glycosyltransferase family 4 protein [Gilvibacter sp.]NQX77811.1 glycosyltransferase family 4 protein [Gilvibacter sp.]